VARAPETLDFEVDRLSPEQYVSSSEEIEMVSRCLNELSPRCRQAVLLSRIEGKRIQEVADTLGVSTRMVKRYISEALVLIRKRLEIVKEKSDE
jgi:RNA polymerase sigma-70 factor (ECF subfamily)